MQNLNLAYIQADLKWEDKAANLQHFSQLLEQVQPDTDLILLPETFTTAFPVDPKQFAGVGRNDPCPCGSGKKFKHCHGRIAA